MGHFSALQKPPPRQTSPPPLAHAQDECSQFFCSGIWGSLCSGTAFFSMEQCKGTPCLCHSDLCVFSPHFSLVFPFPFVPQQQAPRTVGSQGEEKPGVNGNQPRRPLAGSPPRKTGRRQELSVPLRCLCPMGAQAVGMRSHRDPFQPSAPTGRAVLTAPTQGAKSTPGDLRPGAGMGTRLHVFSPR